MTADHLERALRARGVESVTARLSGSCVILSTVTASQPPGAAVPRVPHPVVAFGSTLSAAASALLSKLDDDEADGA